MNRLLALILLLNTVAVAQSKPDVLFIAVDDLNDWTSYLGGHPQTKTPNIDRLVARGTAFTNSHCAAPACNPSRAALMSGLRPWETGIYTNGDPAQGVMKDVITLTATFSPAVTTPSAAARFTTATAAKGAPIHGRNGKGFSLPSKSMRKT